MNDPLHVVGLSGGKDSTALALRLMEIEPRAYEFICNTTGNELPEMLAHWAKLEDMLGTKIKQVRYHTDLFGLIDEQKMLPNFRSRFCTRMLKIEPTIAYFSTLPDDAVLHVGLRADEEIRRGIFGEDMNIKFDMRDWGWAERDVWQYLARRGVTIPDRTDCAVCPYQRLEEWFALWRDYPEQFQAGIDIEERHGHTFRSDKRDTWPASLKELGKAFASGRQLRKSSRGTTCRVCSL